MALIITLAVTFGAQLTLRPLKRLVAGTKRIASGDYAHRVTVTAHNELGELAGEFNSMAAAIDEREGRLIRSERMAAAGQIASHITHEIRNPLSAVSLNTELLEEELEAGLEGERLVEARKLCQAMRREVDRLTDITEEYLRFARLPRPHLRARGRERDPAEPALASWPASCASEGSRSSTSSTSACPPSRPTRTSFARPFSTCSATPARRCRPGAGRSRWRPAATTARWR